MAGCAIMLPKEAMLHETRRDGGSLSGSRPHRLSDGGPAADMAGLRHGHRG